MQLKQFRKLYEHIKNDRYVDLYKDLALQWPVL
jgi:hypothetical protein